MEVRKTLTTREILGALDAIICGKYSQWRKKYPPPKRFSDYEILLAVYGMLLERIADEIREGAETEEER